MLAMFLKREKDDISQLTSVLKENKQEIEFIKEHGSNNQIFLALRKQITNIQKTDNKIHDMTSAINEIDMEFEEIKVINLSLRSSSCFSGFDLIALICFIISDFFCSSNFLLSSRLTAIFSNVSVI
jgi:hypothetical protein